MEPCIFGRPCFSCSKSLLNAVSFDSVTLCLLCG